MKYQYTDFKKRSDFMITKKEFGWSKKIAICFLICLCTLFIPAFGTSASSNVIENNKSGIPDKELYQSILIKLGKKPKEKFTRQEAESIKSLIVYGSGDIESLKGIGYLKGLKRLEVEGQGLSNLKGIQSLTKLEVLNVSDNEIKSLKPLKNLKNLKKLDAIGNNLKNTKGLEKLKKLEKLYLGENHLKSIQELKNLKKLKVVYLYSNNLKNLKGLGKQKKLNRLDVSWNELTGITELKNLTNLKSLVLSRNQIVSLNGLEKQKKLKELYIDRNKLTGIQEVGNLIQLEELSAEQNSLKSLKGIETLKNLTKLNVATNQLENLNYIQNLHSLKDLYTGANHLVKIDEILSLSNLEYLDVSYNKITEFPNLTNLRKLNFIFFVYNFLNEKKDELRKKLPGAYMSSYQNWFEGGYQLQNIDYTIDFTEPADAKMITLDTTRIAGRIHMPAEKVQIKIEEYQDDNSYYKTYFYADVDKDGNFVFEDLNFRQFAEGRCDMQICIGSESDWSYNHFGGPSLYTYQLK